MLNKVRKFIDDSQLLRQDGLYLIALSGGADSVALLLVLKELGYQIEAMHCNFQLRGDESVRDEQYCVALCQRMNIPLHIAHFDTVAYAEVHHVSIEMAARDLRYHYFFQLKDDLGADGICVGHHKEDSVETILINLIRGTGLSGLMGIHAQKNGVVRPLLCVSRKEIESFLESRSVTFVTDSSNLVDDVVRNKIRLNILPLLQEINPSVMEAVLSTARHIGEADKIVRDVLDTTLQKAVCPLKGTPTGITSLISDDEQDQEWAERLRQGNPQGFNVRKSGDFKVDVKIISSFSSPSYLLFFLLKPLGFTPAQIDDICSHLEGQTGQVWFSATHELTHNRGFLFVSQRRVEKPRQLVIPETGRYVYDDVLALRLTLRAVVLSSSPVFSKAPEVVDLDADKIRFPLTLRRVAEGDRFIPLGMRGSQLVSDFLTNLKKNRFEKRDQLVLLDATGTVIWVLGLRINDRCKLTPRTSSCLRVELVKPEEYS